MSLTRAAACRSMAAALFALGATPLVASRALAVEGHRSSVLDVAAADPQLSTFVAAVQASDLATTLNGPGPFTLFAPSDAAFAAYGGGDAAAFLRAQSPAALRTMLQRHIVADVIDFDLDGAMEQKLAAPTEAGNNVQIVVNGRGTTVDGVPVARSLKAGNGQICVIAKVLAPGGAAAS
jgi:uncharacterized surface protein with fasciclin (FAS1) repeats